jgi:hypothetical protein
VPSRRLERIARNEASFRDINEHLEKGLRQVSHLPEPLRFICECGRQDCADTVELSLQEYEAVRRDSRHFAVVPGHALLEAERIVADRGQYQVVEKLGDTVAITDAEDERRPGPRGLREPGA